MVYVTIKTPNFTHHTHLKNYLSFSDGAADLGTTLAGGETGLAGDGKRALLDDLLALGEDELDVARVGHVGVDLGLLDFKC